MTYENMEEVLKGINAEIILPNRAEIKETKKLLIEVLQKLKKYMSENDAIFNELFQEFYYCHNDNLKVNKPYEFDMYFLLALPKCESCGVKNCSCITIKSISQSHYLTFALDDDCCKSVYQKFCRRGIMQTDLIFNWMKSLIYKALNRLKDEREITNFWEVVFRTEHAPSFKIYVKGEFGFVYIDLTAAFKLDQRFWPKKGYKENPTNIDYFTILPKSPEGTTSYWLPSFHAQEKTLIKKKEKLKPALRLLKLMKINRNHKDISNYMLKTLILEELDKYEWMEKSLSDTFMILLKKYTSALREECMPSFWCNDLNLVEDLSSITLQNHYYEINGLYGKIKREYLTNPTIIAEVILRKNSDDYNKFMEIWNGPQWLKNFRIISLDDAYDSDDEYASYDEKSDAANLALAVGATAAGIVTAVGIGALLWEAFSSSGRRRRPSE